MSIRVEQTLSNSTSEALVPTTRVSHAFSCFFLPRKSQDRSLVGYVLQAKTIPRLSSSSVACSRDILPVVYVPDVTCTRHTPQPPLLQPTDGCMRSAFCTASRMDSPSTSVQSTSGFDMWIRNFFFGSKAPPQFRIVRSTLTLFAHCSVKVFLLRQDDTNAGNDCQAVFESSFFV